MEKKFWHELTDKEVQEIIKEKRKFSYIMAHYKGPDWCAHANPIAPGAFGCEVLMNNKNSISLERCSHCVHFKHQ